jgi:hypothetical protein
MKLISFSLLLMASHAFVLLGCSDKETSPVEPVLASAAQTSADLSLAKSGGSYSVVGNAYWKSISCTGETDAKCSFSAIRNGNGSCSGQVIATDKGQVMYGTAQVYDIKVSGNIAKLAFRYTSGNLGGVYVPAVDITKIHGWLIAIDNGGCGKTGKNDMVSLTVFTDGSDIGTETIAGLDKMQPREYLAWAKSFLPPLGIPWEQFLSVPDKGRVEIRSRR